MHLLLFQARQLCLERGTQGVRRRPRLGSSRLLGPGCPLDRRGSRVSASRDMSAPSPRTRDAILGAMRRANGESSAAPALESQPVNDPFVVKLLPKDGHLKRQLQQVGLASKIIVDNVRRKTTAARLIKHLQARWTAQQLANGLGTVNAAGTAAAEFSLTMLQLSSTREGLTLWDKTTVCAPRILSQLARPTHECLCSRLDSRPSITHGCPPPSPVCARRLASWWTATRSCSIRARASSPSMLQRQ